MAFYRLLGEANQDVSIALDLVRSPEQIPNTRKQLALFSQTSVQVPANMSRVSLSKSLALSGRKRQWSAFASF